MKKIHPIWPALLWFIFTTFLLTLPGSAIPKDHWFDVLWVDKWVHIFLFGFLTFLCSRLFLSALVQIERTILITALTCFLYGIAMEFIQKWFVVNRTFDTGDIVADGIGSLFGCFLAIKIYKKSKVNP